MKSETGAPPGVLILVQNLPVPFDRRVWQEACALRDAGYDVQFAAHTPCPELPGILDVLVAEHVQFADIDVRRRQTASLFGHHASRGFEHMDIDGADSLRAEES